MASNAANAGTPAATPELPKIDYIVPPRDNMRLILEHKKPLWVPVMFAENTFCFCPNDNERPYPLSESGKDWFGATWEYVPAVGAQMVPPDTHICRQPSDWRESLRFPDLDKTDFSRGIEEYRERFDNSLKMNMYVMQNGLFERLLDIADSEEAFLWLATEPDDVVEYANAYADFKIKVIDKLLESWAPIDFFALSDDWGTQHGPFMSPEMYEKYFYQPTKRIADHIHSKGLFVNMHSCGKLDGIAPYIAEFADMWEGQPMNDHLSLKKSVGDRLAFTIHLDAGIMAKPDLTEGELVEEVRRKIDMYGENDGMVLFTMGQNAETTEIIMRETYEYSLKKYAKSSF